eukprot:TRINITY_DN602_c0_g1_i2.p4 TRINITY_DN602_c0_g1~~TRINITY_DN602_c0_g1_i2.p4  ORF type:complete len:103 (+),score=43.45 TRINITY_DN602_c0_g1_i2:873-1181(+)
MPSSTPTKCPTEYPTTTRPTRLPTKPEPPKCDVVDSLTQRREEESSKEDFENDVKELSRFKRCLEKRRDWLDERIDDMTSLEKRKSTELRGRSSETAKAHRG